MTVEQLNTLLCSLKHPYTKCNFKEDELPICIFDETKTKLTLSFSFPKGQTEAFDTFQRTLLKALKIDQKIPSVKLIYAEAEATTPIEAEVQTESSAPLGEFSTIKQLITAKKVHVIGIISGKGGVGKSQTTIHLAKALQRRGEKVALIDADIYGASLQKILNNTEKALNQSQSVRPLVIEDIEIVSSQMFSDGDNPIIWRGPMLGKLLRHFFEDILWSSETTYILIDLPPGTGDIPLDLQHLAPQLDVILVTTPHPNAAFVASKSGVMAQNMNQHVIGVIENMSYFIGNDGEKYALFGKGGGVQIAQALNTTLLAQIPLSSADAPIDLGPYFDQLVMSLI